MGTPANGISLLVSAALMNHQTGRDTEQSVDLFILQGAFSFFTLLFF